jgi:hypothetical protein
VLAVVVGYAAMVLLITLVQEVLFGGVSFHTSSFAELVAAGGLTFLCACTGGFLAAVIAGRRAHLHALAMSVMVGIETTVLVLTGRVGGRLWFDLAAAGSLVVGIFLGAEVFGVLNSRRIPSARARSEVSG